MSRYSYPKPTLEEITPKELFLSRRKIMMGLGASLLAAGRVQATAFAEETEQNSPEKMILSPQNKKNFAVGAKLTSFEDVTHYNNFYEFGLGKEDPSQNSSLYHPFPWSLEIDGLVKKPLKIDIATLLKSSLIEERIYRMRCVEAWSMVIPWDGIMLSHLIEQAEPLPQAKYVAFESITRPEEMTGQQDNLAGITWPYREGLRLDEAMHPLTLLALGVYGQSLPAANGAPVRLVVPWKYGFKGIKAIRRISLVEAQPISTWNQLAPQEYGFYANVNPHVDHPRWSQAEERVIGSHSLFGEERRATELFNGYQEQVASLYRGMDLRENF